MIQILYVCVWMDLIIIYFPNQNEQNFTKFSHIKIIPDITFYYLLCQLQFGMGLNVCAGRKGFVCVCVYKKV